MDRLTRDADNAQILQGLFELGRAIRYAILATATGIAAGILSMLISEWVAVGTLALFAPIAVLGIFRAWRVCRSKRWDDYWEQKQELDVAKTTALILVVPGGIAATISAGVLMVNHWSTIASTVTNLTTTLTGML